VPVACDKPGHGYGDKNHCHFGPPGHDTLISSDTPAKAAPALFLFALAVGLAFAFTRRQRRHA
jgi:MYXO-CTERM domain-containing protein